MTDHFADAGKPMPEPLGYFRPEPFGWTDCAETDEGAQPLFDLETVEALQASLVEARNRLGAYAKVKAADEATVNYAVMWISLLCEAAGFDPEGTTVEFSDRKGGLPPITVSVAGTITALKERLK